MRHTIGRLTWGLLLGALALAASGTTFDTSVNLLSNGDAESGLDGWSYVVNFAVATGDSAGGPGTHCFEVDATGAAYGEFVHNTIPVTPGARIRLQGQFKTLSGATLGVGGAVVFVRYYTGGGSWLGQEELALDLTGGQWVGFAGEFTAWTGADHIDVYFAIGKWGAFDGVARLDDVAVYREVTLDPPTEAMPADNTKFGVNEVVLGWQGAAEAESYDVYIGTRLEDVLAGTRLTGDYSLDGRVDAADVVAVLAHWLQLGAEVGTPRGIDWGYRVDLGDLAVVPANWAATSEVFRANVAGPSYDPGPLPLGHCYYWRVDQVVGTSTTAGPVWSYHASYAELDDVEAYGPGTPLTDTWTDAATNNTGATVSLTTSAVHGGGQALALAYDNRGLAGRAAYSETECDFGTGQDWASLGAELLWVHFRGQVGNAMTAAERPYLALEDAAGHRAWVHYESRYGELADWAGSAWQVWQVDLDDFAGVDLAAVRKLAIGLGDPQTPTTGGTGAVYVDDLQLWAEHNQLFPAGASPQSIIDYVDLTSATLDQKLAAITLQGQVHAQGPGRIFLNLANWDLFWRNQLTTQGHVDQFWLKSLDVLFGKYAPYYDKVIIYDPAVPATINVATMMAGVQRGVVVGAGDVSRFGSGKAVEDLRGRWATNVEAYEWAWQNLAPQMRRNVLAMYHPTATNHHIRDYLVQQRVFTLWVTGAASDDGVVSDHAAERAFAETVFAATPPNTPIIGWWGGGAFDEGLGEYVGVGLAGEYGLPTVGCDWTTNMSLLSGVEIDWTDKIEAYTAARPTTVPTLDASKVYVCLAYIDAGDAPVYWEGVQNYVWQNGYRGDFPIGWSLGPGALELLPHCMAWFYDEATPQDVFFFAPSGAGYVHPYRSFMSRTAAPAAAWDRYVALTDRYLKWLDVKDVSLYTTAWSTFDRAVHDTTTQRFIDGLENLRVLILGMGRDEGIADWQYLMGADDVLVTHTRTRWDSSNIGRNPANNTWLVNEVLSQTPPTRPAFMLVYPLTWNYWPADLQAVLGQLGPEYVPASPRDFKLLYHQANP